MSTQTASQGFLLKQQSFEGPLDLLLGLIESEELDITTISLAKVTEDYLGYVREMERQNLPEISDFLVIAARLILLKSRALLPVESEAELEEDDLAARLAEYKLYKTLSAQIGEQLGSSEISLGKPPAVLQPPSAIVTDGVDLAGLTAAFNEVLADMPVELPKPTKTLEEKITIAECITRVRGEVRSGPKPFDALFRALRTRVAVIVTFLAILELVKQRLVSIQSEEGGLMVGARA